MVDAPEGMFSEGEQNKLLKWKDYITTYKDQFKELQESGFEEDAFKTFKKFVSDAYQVLIGKMASKAQPR